MAAMNVGVITLSVWLVPALGLLACLLGVAVLSAVETALIGVSEARVRAAVERGVKGAQHLVYWLEHAAVVLSTIHLLRLLLIVLGAMAGVGIAGVVAARLPALEIPIALSATLLAVLFLVVGVMLPSTMAKRYAFAWAKGSIRVVRWLTVVMSPVVWPLWAFARWVSRLGGGSVGEGSAFWTPEELRRLTTDAQADGLNKQHEKLLDSIFEFSDTIIREIMVPRTEMIAVPVTTTEAELRETIVEAGHSRIPVYEETIDNIIGVLHVKDLFPTTLVRGSERNGGRAFDLRALSRRMFYVPEVMKISELLREFQRRKTHMAIVVDEYGGTAGVVTLEDIIEEIVGEIQDEYDVDEKQYRVTADDKIIADGRVSVWDLEEALTVKFPEDAGYETLAGFLMHRAGYLPRPGTVITWNDLRFTVKEANEKRIGTVEIERRSAQGNGQSVARV